MNPTTGPDPEREPDRDRDRQRVAELLGREPQGDFDVVVRDATGDPVVIRNSPLLADGTPMPTRYWLVSAFESRRIGTLEASGGVNAAEADIDPAELADAHRRYAAERDSVIDSAYDGPRPSGGVGGTRTGVKCLHSHWAWYLAGGDDPVGRWIEAALAGPDRAESGDDNNGVGSGTGTNTTSTNTTSTVETGTVEIGTVEIGTVEIGTDETVIHHQEGPFALGWGAANLAATWFGHADPPQPEDLTNALGAVDDDLDDLDRELGPIVGPVNGTRSFMGSPASAVARLEIGATELPVEHVISRSDLEEIFRLAATESTQERRDNPGLVDGDEQIVLPALCIVVAIARRYRLAEVRLVQLR